MLMNALQIHAETVANVKMVLINSFAIVRPAMVERAAKEKLTNAIRIHVNMVVSVLMV